jgi:quinol monooxygenase YgiN
MGEPMIIRMATFTLGPDTAELAKQAADTSAKLFRTNPDCLSCTYFADWEKGEYGLASVWKTRDAAEAATKANAPQMTQIMGASMKDPPTVRFYDVYEPKT